MSDVPASPEPKTPAEHRVIHDPRVLRALAHPVRYRILDEMSATGPTRAADVARDLGIPANQASFHLRQLAKYGLVEEAPDEARDGRDRVWRLSAPDGLTLRLGELEQVPGGRAAVEVWRRHSASWAHQVVDAAFAPGPDPQKEPDAVQPHRTVSDQTLRLTREEAEQLMAELTAVVRGWAGRTRGRDAERRTYLLLQLLQTYPEGLGRAPAAAPADVVE